MTKYLAKSGSLTVCTRLSDDIKKGYFWTNKTSTRQFLTYLLPFSQNVWKKRIKTKRELSRRYRCGSQYPWTTRFREMVASYEKFCIVTFFSTTLQHICWLRKTLLNHFSKMVYAALLFSQHFCHNVNMPDQKSDFFIVRGVHAFESIHFRKVSENFPAFWGKPKSASYQRVPVKSVTLSNQTLNACFVLV